VGEDGGDEGGSGSMVLWAKETEKVLATGVALGGGARVGVAKLHNGPLLLKLSVCLEFLLLKYKSCQEARTNTSLCSN
jgi:hypothetical protein